MFKKTRVFKFLFLIAAFSFASSISFAATVTKESITTTAQSGTLTINVTDMFGESGAPSSFVIDSISIREADINGSNEFIDFTIAGETFRVGNGTGGVDSQCVDNYETITNYSNKDILSAITQSGSDYEFTIGFSASAAVGILSSCAGVRMDLKIVATAEFGDSTPPTMAITSSTVSDGDASNDSLIALTFTSSEATTDFVVGDVSVSGGSLTNFSASSSTVYTATFTPSGDGATTIDVSANTFNDAASNGNTAASQFNWTYDLSLIHISEPTRPY